MSNSAANLRADVARIIFQVLEQGEMARPHLQAKQKLYSPRDRAWLQEMTFGVLRQVPTLQFWLRQLLDKPLKGNKKILEHLLMVGLYQLAFSRVGDHAAVSETVNAAEQLGGRNLKGLINAILREFQRSEMQQTQPDSLAAQAGLPNWLYKQLATHYPQQMSTIIERLNHQADLWLRINTRNISTDDYCAALQAADIDFVRDAQVPNAIRIAQHIAIEQLPGYQAGWFMVQDRAAQLAAHILAPQAGQRVLDCCAAPGGKTAHILDICQPSKLTAIDIEGPRLQRLNENLQRCHLHSKVLECVQADALSNTWWDGQGYDCILLDAPCSATGVLRRHPDIRWLRTQAQVETLHRVQQQLLNAMWHKLNVGGRLLYATCSLLPSENIDQVQSFVAANNDAVLLDLPFSDQQCWQILPGDGNMDGFFYALLEKRAVV